jgi:VanZ family protein
MKKNLTLLFRVLLAVYLICVFVLCFGNFSGLPDIEEKILGFDPDKIVHFLMFLPFPVLAYGALGRQPAAPGKALVWALLLFLAGSVLAAGTEIGQHFLPYRNSDPKDFSADALALAIGALITLVVMHFKGLRNTRPER